MTTSADYIHCMLIPLQQHYLLLPNSTIAEVIPKTRMMQQTNAAEPDKGLRWRDQYLPIIDLENLIEHRDYEADNASKLCILIGINAEAKVPFYALPCCGAPQLITLNESALQQTNGRNHSKFLFCQIQIGNKVAYIPNLDQLELHIRNQPK